jgi:hypothetical protein
MSICLNVHMSPCPYMSTRPYVHMSMAMSMDTATDMWTYVHMDVWNKYTWGHIWENSKIDKYILGVFYVLKTFAGFLGLFCLWQL